MSLFQPASSRPTFLLKRAPPRRRRKQAQAGGGQPHRVALRHRGAPHGQHGHAPGVADFIDILSYRGQELEIEILTVDDGPGLIGQRIADLRRSSQAAVLAVTRRDGRLIANPGDDETLQKGDRLIALGTRQQVHALESYCERCKIG
jgi:hypothetical protein